MAENPRIALIGGAGYIGSVLLRLLLQENYPVKVFDNFSFGRQGLDNLDSPLLEVVDADICDTQALSQAINGIDCVIFLAGVIGHRGAEVKRNDIRDINLLASSVVLDAAMEHGVRRFIFASSDSVYGQQSGVMYETTIPYPVSLFSRLKLRLEERIIRAKNRFFHPTALRIATCHGVAPRMRFDLMPNSLVRDAICKKKLIIESGLQCRALVHVEDAARSFLTCLKSHENLISGEIFNVDGLEKNTSLEQLAKMVAAIIPGTEVSFLEGEPDLIDYRLSCSKITKILDFTPRWTLEKSLEQMRDLLLNGKIDNPYSLRYTNT